MNLTKLIQKLKCKIGWHLPGVYGHMENTPSEMEEMVQDKEYLNEIYNVQYEYYMCCIACNDTLAWNYQYRLPKLKYVSYYVKNKEISDEFKQALLDNGYIPYKEKEQ